MAKLTKEERRLQLQEKARQKALKEWYKSRGEWSKSREKWAPKGSNATKLTLKGVDWSQGPEGEKLMKDLRAQQKAEWEFMNQDPSGKTLGELYRSYLPWNRDPEYADKLGDTAAEKVAEKQRYQDAVKSIRKAGWKDKTVYSWVDEDGKKQFGSKFQRDKSPAYIAQQESKAKWNALDPRLKKEIERRYTEDRAKYNVQEKMAFKKIQQEEQKFRDQQGDPKAYKQAWDSYLKFKDENKVGAKPGQYNYYPDASKIDWGADYLARLDSDPKFAEAEAARPSNLSMAYRDKYMYQFNPEYQGWKTWGGDPTTNPKYEELKAWENKYGDVYKMKDNKVTPAPTAAHASIMANPYEPSHKTISEPFNTQATRDVIQGKSGVVGDTNAGDAVYNPNTKTKQKVKNQLMLNRQRKASGILDRQVNRIFT